MTHTNPINKQQPILLHGVFMNIFGVGTLLTGSSGVGKSELALALISRGHQLIADDAPEFFIANNGSIMGRSPAPLKHLLEVRGLCAFNIFNLFGHAAIAEENNLSLIIHLQKTTQLSRDITQLPVKKTSVLDTLIAQIILPFVTDRRFDVIVETLVRYFQHLSKDIG